MQKAGITWPALHGQAWNETATNIEQNSNCSDCFNNEVKKNLKVILCQ